MGDGGRGRDGPAAAGGARALQALDDGAGAEAAAAAHGDEAVCVPSVRSQLVQRLGDEEGAGAAERVAEGDGAAVGVGAARGRRRARVAQASTTEANASLISMMSMSAMVMPVRSSRRWVASIGPVSMSTGSTPTRQVSTMRASGREPEGARPSRAVIISTAAAPSEICDDDAGGVHAVLAGDRLERGQRLERGLAQALVARRRGGSCRWACPRRRGRGRRSGTIWVPKRSSAHACGGALLGAQAELVGVVRG